MSTLNNLDDALTPLPPFDPWVDDAREATEATERSSLHWGTAADVYFAAAHAAGAALRRLRRQRATPRVDQQVAQVVEHEPGEPRVGRCTQCNRSRTTDKAHDRCAEPIVLVAEPDYDVYYDRLARGSKGPQPRFERQVDVPAMWRVVPGYDNYVMHSKSRRVCRQAYERVLPNGGTRRYPARECEARNGSYSLTTDGVTSSRGVNSLWRETFPEFNKGWRKRKDGEWSAEIEFRRDEMNQYNGLADWLGEGGVHIVTRPQ